METTLYDQIIARYLKIFSVVSYTATQTVEEWIAAKTHYLITSQKDISAAHNINASISDGLQVLMFDTVISPTSHTRLQTIISSIHTEVLLEITTITHGEDPLYHDSTSEQQVAYTLALDNKQQQMDLVNHYHSGIDIPVDQMIEDLHKSIALSIRLYQPTTLISPGDDIPILPLILETRVPRRLVYSIVEGIMFNEDMIITDVEVDGVLYATVHFAAEQEQLPKINKTSSWYRTITPQGTLLLVVGDQDMVKGLYHALGI